MPWQREVETHIRHDLLYWLTASGASGDDPRGLVILDALGSPIGVGAHRRCDIDTSRYGLLTAREIHVVALATRWQGCRVSDLRASDMVMSVVLADILSRPDNVRFTHAVVHRENVRSLALCRRHGLTEEYATGAADYVRLVTPPQADHASSELD